MDSCNLFCQTLSGINWWWFAVAVIVAFGVGAVWYSVLFAKAWIRVFKVEQGEVTTGSFLRTMSIQLIASILYGLMFFVLTQFSVSIAFLCLIGFSVWEKGNLNFEFAKMKDFITAAIIKVGYTFIAGLIFILFALI